MCAFVSHLPVLGGSTIISSVAPLISKRANTTTTSRRPRSVCACSSSAAVTPTASCIEKGSRVRVKADVDMYHIPNHRNEPFNVVGLEGVVFQDLPFKWGDKITATKQYQVKFTDPKFMGHFDADEIELLD